MVVMFLDGAFTKAAVWPGGDSRADCASPGEGHRRICHPVHASDNLSNVHVSIRVQDKAIFTFLSFAIVAQNTHPLLERNCCSNGSLGS